MQHAMVVPLNKWKMTVSLGIVAGIILLCGALVFERMLSPADPPNKLANPIGVAPRGYWHGVGGDVNISERAVGELYNYDWFAIDIIAPYNVRLTWDNGIGCSRTEGVIVGRTVQLQEQGVLATFVFHDENSATVTFHEGRHTWIKHLEKKRNDPAVLCY